MFDIEKTIERLVKRGFTPADLKVPRPLTLAEWQEISKDTDLQDLHLYANTKAVDAVHDAEKKQAENKKNAKAWKQKAMWDGEAGYEEENAEAYKACELFAARYPQFSPQLENQNLLLYMKQNNIAVTFESLVQAFEHLASHGLLILLPSAIGIQGDEITGAALRNHPKLDILLQ